MFLQLLAATFSYTYDFVRGLAAVSQMAERRRKPKNDAAPNRIVVTKPSLSRLSNKAKTQMWSWMEALNHPVGEHQVHSFEVFVQRVYAWCSVGGKTFDIGPMCTSIA